MFIRNPQLTFIVSVTCARASLMVLTASLTASVWAQKPGLPTEPWLCGAEVPWESAISKPTVNDFIRECRLSDAQQQTAWSIYQQHLARFAELVARGQKADDETAKVLSEAPAIEAAAFHARIQRAKLLAPLADEQAALDAKAMQELQALLSDDQRVPGTRFLQAYHRRLWRSAPWYNDENLDLLTILDDLKLDSSKARDSAAFAQLQIAYGDALDEALKDRNVCEVRLERTRWKDQMERSESDGNKVWMRPPTEAEARKFDADARNLRRVHRAVRDVNRTFLQMFQSEFDVELAAELVAAYRKAARPELYDPSWMRGAKYLETSMKLDDLSNDQRDAVQGTLVEYQTARDAVNERILRAEDEVAALTWDLDRMKDMREAKEKAAELWQARKALEEKTVEKVWVLLSEEQRGRAPKPQVIAQE